MKDLRGRFEYSVGVANAESQSITRYTDDPAFWIYEPFHRDIAWRGTGHSHQLDLRLLESARATVEASIYYTNASSGFHNYQGTSIAYIYSEGEQLNMTADFDLNGTGISFETDDENNISLSTPYFTLKGTSAKEYIGDPGITYIADDIVKTRLFLTLPALMSDAPRWLPDDVSIGMTRRNSLQQTALKGPLGREQFFGVGVSKTGENYFF